MKFHKVKNFYESVKVPEELDDTIKNATKSKKHRFYLNHVLSLACTFCLAFIVLVNVNPAFADASYDIPIIGQLAKIVTIKEYSEANDAHLIHVRIPAIENTGNSDLEKIINNEIETKINLLVEDAKLRAREFKDMVDKGNFIDSTYYPMELEVNYEIKYKDENTLSFIIYKYESGYSFFQEKLFYNIDLKTGKEITLEDILGENYQEIASNQINEQIEYIKKTDEKAAFFDEGDNPILEHGAAFNEIDANQSYYLNDKKNPVIVFPKYSIAPGYMGELEFEILKASN